MAQWLSWLERRPVTAEVTGSSPVWVVHKWTTVERLLCILCINYGILAQLGEHLPYKQRVTGSSPVGPIFCFLNKITCRSGGTGRRPVLKSPWVVIPVPVRFRSAADYYIQSAPYCQQLFFILLKKFLTIQKSLHKLHALCCIL